MCGASDTIVRTWLLLWVRWEPWQEQAWTTVLTGVIEKRGEGRRKGDLGDCSVVQSELEVPGNDGGGGGEEGQLLRVVPIGLPHGPSWGVAADSG